jgi:hypothetical protein
MLSGIVIVLAALFALREPFDEMHQKRLFVLHTENVTTGERSLHVAAADGAPGLEGLVRHVARVFGEREGAEEGERELVPVQMDGYNSDWDTLYPFSSVCFCLLHVLREAEVLGWGVVLDAVQDSATRGSGVRLAVGSLHRRTLLALGCKVGVQVGEPLYDHAYEGQKRPRGWDA